MAFTSAGFGGLSVGLILHYFSGEDRNGSVSDVIEGATINLMGTSASEVRLAIANDRSTLKTNIQDMVSNYNSLLTSLDNFIAVDSDTEMAGALSEDGALVRFL